MEKAKKAEVVEDLNGVFSKAGSVVVAHYSGMTVAQMSDLRSRMRAAGASFRVAKNRLAVRALKGTPIEGIAHLFKGPTGIAVSDDPVAASKVAAAYAKDNDKLVILGGSVGVTALDAAASKPSQPCRRSMNCGARSWACLWRPRPRSPGSFKLPPVSLPVSSGPIPRRTPLKRLHQRKHPNLNQT